MKNLLLNPYDRKTFYEPPTGEGYTDYPIVDEESEGRYKDARARIGLA